MNILEQTEALKDLPDAALIQQMKMPTGEIAPIFITSELKRRKRMRDDYARREAADTPTVAEEVVMAAGMPQGGIADAARALAPKTDMGQNTGMGDMMPRTATQAPQPMASGGIVGMRQGGKLVKLGSRNYYAFPDGEVYVEYPSGEREKINPSAAAIIRREANIGPERQESAAPLGSEILQEAAPERPTLDSTISSDRPFNPQQMEVTDTRPAVPSSLGMGGERPSTLTDVTQPTALSEMEKARLATEFTQQQELARAIRDQQEQGIASLNPPSADVGPTVDLGLTTDQRISQEDMAMAVPVPQGQPRNFTQLLSDQAQPYEGGQTTRDEALRALSDRYNAAIAKAGSYDDLSPKERLGFAAEYSMVSPDRVLVKDNESPEIVSRVTESLLPPTATFGGDFLGESQARANAANLKELRKTQPNVDVGTDPRFGDTMGLQEVLAGDFDPVSDASSKPATPYVPFIPIEPRVGERSIGVAPTGFIDDDIAPFDPADIANTTVRSDDLRGDPGQYGFPQAENIAMGESIAELDKQLKELPSELSNVPTDLNLADVTSKALQEASFDMPSSLTQPVPSGTADDPVVLSEKEAVGIEAARPKAAPVALKAERDAAKLSAPDGGGITTVSTKAINDAAKQSKGLSTDAWLAIAQGGAAMAASKNPTLLGAFGEGAGVAAAGLQKQRAAEKTAGLAQAKIDATLEAARIRAAASMAGRARPQVTETALFTELSKELRDKEFLLNSAGDNLAPAIRDSLTKRVEEIKERLARVERGESLIGPVAGGTDDVKKISLP